MKKENVKSEEFNVNDYMTLGQQIKFEILILILTIWFMSPFLLLYIYFIR